MVESASRRNAKSVMLSISLAIEAIGGIYLLTSDTYLKQSGNSLHWDGLLVFSIVNVLLLLLVLFSSGRAIRLSAGVWSLLGILAILGDAASNLAYSSFYGTQANEGWRYLFGFGYVSGGSVFATSLAVVVILIFSVVSAIIAFLTLSGSRGDK